MNSRFMAMIGGETNTMFEGTSKKMAFTHHQKYVIMDTPRADGGEGRELFAFVGGIDLTLGRWDNRKVSIQSNAAFSQITQHPICSPHSIYVYAAPTIPLPPKYSQGGHIHKVL